ncbi:putative FBD-associated F-box protein At1g05080 [Raphanus sativus]|uniref:FBD-associated F-box protein At1g05080 n=1 Tax=Raphanus sativus TaxID=3726 RepID=A0A9W3DHN0_RAPSA|nr:putative FBD-associated F-box protein At1g05080 [Raphanus sativus]
MTETAENSVGRVEEIGCEDSISSLPDDLLVTILSSIPTKDAISTMILSKRWRFIWTLLPILAYEESKSKISVWWVLNKSMEFHKAPALHNLSIQLGRHCPIDADVGKWVENAVNHGVRELFFTLQWSADPTRLPKSLNTCKTLLHLKLSHKILVDSPTSSCLPSLKNLKLYYVVYKDEVSLVALLSSCPVLELLYVKRNEDDNVAKFSVKVPSLRVFVYFNAMSPDENDVVDDGRSLIIDTPALTHFHISDDSGDSWSIKSMPLLQYVFISGQSFHDISKLLRSASAVSSLELDLTDELAVYCSTIEFSQLIHCTISPCDSDWMDSLILFLGNTPKLKRFTVDYSLTDEPPAASDSWMLRLPHPECLSSSLEKFELIDYGGREEEKALVEYILETSKCLKSVTISLRSNLKNKKKKMKRLNAIFQRFSSISFFVQTQSKPCKT